MAPSHYIERSFGSSEAGSSLRFERALDVQPSPLSHAQVLAESATSTGNRTSLIIVLSVVLGVIGIAALVALYFIVTQRKQLRQVRTIRVIYNVDNIPSDTASVTSDNETKVADSDDAKSIQDDITVESFDDDEKPRILHEPTNEKPHVLGLPILRRKRSRAPQPLTIVIPSGGGPADIEIVNGQGSAVTVSTARRSAFTTPVTAVSSISTAKINVVEEKVYVSNGWAPATIVYLPQNPKARASRRMTNARTPRKTPRTAGYEPKEMKEIPL
ncbi:hypothetical protein EXIGLDRAFT_836569 [Exidia glandulosa HHB12029]|uniref:Uncharacterized protein n=1 Tax=Exidia glandulosa HHB12029 TaxID=1314781 RepID=A0A165HPN9_EXIGL|nr:hypothetical protein EXIGLDRAFT_836569 [Exidia glandulosa HHB12029]